MVTRRTTSQLTTPASTIQDVELDMSQLNDKAIAALLKTANAEKQRRAKLKQEADKAEEARKEEERKEQARKEAQRIAEENARKEDREQEKAAAVNVRLSQIRVQLNSLEREIESLVNSVDPKIVYVGFSYCFGDSNTSSYNNSDQYWSSSGY